MVLNEDEFAAHEPSQYGHFSPLIDVIPHQWTDGVEHDVWVVWLFLRLGL